MRRFPKYTCRLIFALLLFFTLIISMSLRHTSTASYPLQVGASSWIHFWLMDGRMGMQHNEWLNPPRPINISDPSTQVSGLRILASSSNDAFVHYAKWEDGLEDRSVNPPAFFPVGHVTQEWYFSIHWLVLLALIPTAYYLWKWIGAFRAHRRLHKNLCLNCSYDLRAHQPGTNCPECGTPIPAPPPQLTEPPAAQSAQRPPPAPHADASK